MALAAGSRLGVYEIARPIVSSRGGVFQASRSDGNELYFINPSGAILATAVDLTAKPPILGESVQFITNLLGGGLDSPSGRQYDVAPTAGSSSTRS